MITHCHLAYLKYHASKDMDIAGIIQNHKDNCKIKTITLKNITNINSSV